MDDRWGVSTGLRKAPPNDLQDSGGGVRAGQPGACNQDLAPRDGRGQGVGKMRASERALAERCVGGRRHGGAPGWRPPLYRLATPPLHVWANLSQIPPMLSTCIHPSLLSKYQGFQKPEIGVDSLTHSVTAIMNAVVLPRRSSFPSLGSVVGLVLS